MRHLIKSGTHVWYKPGTGPGATKCGYVFAYYQAYLHIESLGSLDYLNEQHPDNQTVLIRECIYVGSQDHSHWAFQSNIKIMP